MKIIVGLGNPGQKFENTPHNFGFMVIDAFAEKDNFPDFKVSKKFNSLISEDRLNTEKTVLAKPQTFMNESGKAIKKIVSHYKLPPIDLIIVHDDIDLPFGTIKIVKNRGSAGHKGIESIIKELSSKNFTRIRLGIKPGRPNSYQKKVSGARFVIKRFNPREKTIVADTIKKTADAIEFLVKDGLEKAMNEYNK
ncbi:aminoacyl-tRNA hydrolase [Patescibacteria group bacterium]|nr:aminoacyl-tRNA hydrolase [Patescibacteria group bacterium]MBU4367418.1 aminoacyl-tRNA hydrolase [Patescibacteria group bacterium]MBU4461738.1 aminoacyl-tRNA hydrolase [Patescibacteria group bacterium]MCG2700122.1 aminoacyl-tRNA hydrolase [Candidatus Parcubacteria bacterium]